MTNSPLTFKCFGARGATCQLPRIEQGFIDNGLSETHDGKPSFVYANDSGGWQAAIDYHDAVSPNSKLILNVLDIPEWNLPQGYDPKSLEPLLARADAVTVISEYVGRQIVRYFNFVPWVVYNPIKPINSDKRKAGQRPYPEYKAMMVGRLRDPSKRANLGVQALILAGFEEGEVAVVGSESIGWGTYLGVVSDTVLNDLYNSVDYVVMTSLGEGLGLPALEGLAGGAIPIVCHDLTTFAEFYNRNGCYPNAHSIANLLKKFQNDPAFLAKTKDLALKLSVGVPMAFSGQAVASRILGVYDKLVSPQSIQQKTQ